MSHDWYYRSIPAHLVGHPRLAFEYNFDHPDALDNRLLDQHLADLACGRGVVAPEYDYASATEVPGRRSVKAAEIVVVDGILRHARGRTEPVRPHRVRGPPADIRLARRIRRDVIVRKLQFESVLDLYEASVRPMHERFVEPSKDHADLVVSGTRPVDELVKVVLTRLPKPSRTVTWLGPYGPACDDACWKCSGCGSYEEGPPKTCPRCGGDTA